MAKDLEIMKMYIRGIDNTTKEEKYVKSFISRKGTEDKESHQ